MMIIELFDHIPLWSILMVTALVAGFIDAIVGGGGLLTVPALLGTGMPVHTVLGTNKLASTFGTAAASFTFYRHKLFSPSLWIHCCISTLIGALIGVISVYFISGEYLEKLLPILIIATAIYTLLKKPTSDKHFALITTPSKRKQWLQGLTLGFYDGFAGPGTGAFWTVSSQIIYKVDLMISSGIARSMNFISNLTALITFAILGKVDYEVGLLMGGCLMIGSIIGAKSAIHLGPKLVRPIFIAVVLVISIKLAWGAWF